MNEVLPFLILGLLMAAGYGIALIIRGVCGFRRRP